MGRLASSQVLQTVTWKRIHGGEKKNKSKNKKQPVKQAESLFGGQSHLHDWDAGESHTHLGASCVSLRFCALCHDRTLLRILIALFCHCLAIYRDNHTEVRWTQDPDSAGLICFKEDTDRLQRRSGIQGWRAGPSCYAALTAFWERRGKMATSERVHSPLDLRSSIANWKASHCKGHIYTALAASISSLFQGPRYQGLLTRIDLPAPHPGSTWWETQKGKPRLLASGHSCSGWSSEAGRCRGTLGASAGLPHASLGGVM